MTILEHIARAPCNVGLHSWTNWRMFDIDRPSDDDLEHLYWTTRFERPHRWQTRHCTCCNLAQDRPLFRYERNRNS